MPASSNSDSTDAMNRRNITVSGAPSSTTFSDPGPINASAGVCGRTSEPMIAYAKYPLSRVGGDLNSSWTRPSIQRSDLAL
jgi:hypothetical protein